MHLWLDIKTATASATDAIIRVLITTYTKLYVCPTVPNISKTAKVSIKLRTRLNFGGNLVKKLQRNILPHFEAICFTKLCIQSGFLSPSFFFTYGSGISFELLGLILGRTKMILLVTNTIGKSEHLTTGKPCMNSSHKVIIFFLWFVFVLTWVKVVILFGQRVYPYTLVWFYPVRKVKKQLRIF